ncbi:hypothetical protein RFI_17966 [Reticulomyxa filosa]|uniref:Dynein axonemal assembly factor 5 TPR repeats domain-containing protein n=1 Tax=Reticulomyxa filosa TaxID=46433 RepID=X6N035_RETFI|nr:hypothetical protein RFI_17966 [Reticulomyxa filosa]|eukprot:ETO19263.1 hypothetical protein RFI_17966 [Reticulomyxa filosa]
MKTLEQIIVGLGKRFEAEMTEELLQLLERTAAHINRFVREVTLQSFESICKSHSSKGLEKVGIRIAKVIRAGLSDNWSQVRYASSLAARAFFDTVVVEHHREYFPILLPPLCLNRYYTAAGVRIHVLESWKKLVFSQGLESGAGLVAEFIDDIVVYFAQQARADNHTVRQAACHCIVELATKVDHQAVSKHVTTLVEALMACFKDEAWAVRDAACIGLLLCFTFRVCQI